MKYIAAILALFSLYRSGAGSPLVAGMEQGEPGDTTLAVENYRKSLALDPENTNAEEVLKRLQNQPRAPDR